MPTISKLYSMEEASQHNTKDDCWVVIDGKVYDLSSYMDDHPGGDDVILAATAKDATDDFEDAGHSKSARELMETFFIGELDKSTLVTSKNTVTEPVIDNSEGFLHLTKKYWAVPVAVVGISVVVGGILYMRKK